MAWFVYSPSGFTLVIGSDSVMPEARNSMYNVQPAMLDKNGTLTGQTTRNQDHLFVWKVSNLQQSV